MKMKFLLTLLLPVMVFGAEIFPAREKMAIVIPENPNYIEEFAAGELQYHLQLVFGYQPEIRKGAAGNGKAFYLMPCPEDKTPLRPEEARWRIMDDGRIFIYGENNPVRGDRNIYRDLMVRSRIGTLYAVYDFLNNVLQIRHIEPGEKGIVYRKMSAIPADKRANNWQSVLEFRELRNGLPTMNAICKANFPAELTVDPAAFAKVENELNLWKVRMRLGRRTIPVYGHAFLYWWKNYGKEHPEYFAMDEVGRRQPPESMRNGHQRIQLCMSNPAVVDQIVANWAVRKGPFINLCPNDSTLFCRCPECRKLGSKSDMMIYQANAVLAKAKKIRPDVRGTTYAYLDYIYGPKVQKVDPSMVIGFVSIFLNLPKMEQYYKEWQAMGNKSIFLRPNTFWVDIGVPLGYEKSAWEEFILGTKYNVIGVDVDSLQNDWSINGITPYILARAYTDPEKSFEYWEDEYCTAYGAAKEPVKAYFRFLRHNIWEKRVLSRVSVDKMYDNLSYYVIPRVKEIVTPEIYMEAGKLLAGIDRSKLSAAENRRLEALILENQHAVLQAQVLHAHPSKKLELNRKLLTFRIANRDKLNIFWPILLEKEELYDLTGMKAAEQFKDCSYAEELPVKWFFEVDPEDRGEKDKWYMYPYARISATWVPVPVNCAWETFSPAAGVPAGMAKAMQKYDGIGWYALRVKIDPSLKGKKVFLHFGAIDESGKIWVDGKLLHIRKFLHKDDWKKSFDVEITDQINWQKKYVDVVVKVEDKGGQGGMWKPVWLTGK